MASRIRATKRGSLAAGEVGFICLWQTVGLYRWRDKSIDRLTEFRFRIRTNRNFLPHSRLLEYRGHRTLTGVVVLPNTMRTVLHLPEPPRNMSPQQGMATSVPLVPASAIRAGNIVFFIHLLVHTSPLPRSWFLSRSTHVENVRHAAVNAEVGRIRISQCLTHSPVSSPCCLSASL
jgi:hypothetical protein